MRRIAALALPLALAAALLVAAAVAATFSGTIEAGDPTQSSRLVRNTVVSSCAAAKTNPGVTSPGARHYDSYSFTNSSGAAQCVTVTLAATFGTELFVAAYSGSFNPATPSLNYLADPGLSGPLETFSFVVAAGATYVVVVHELNVSGCIGCTYTLDVSSAAATAVSFRSLSETATRGGSLIRWRTASELDLLGFNVLRAVHGQRARVNQRLIRAHGPGAYSFLDSKAAKGARYWIQAVNLDGSRSSYGPARSTVPAS